jgi:hypothetical protein
MDDRGSIPDWGGDFSLCLRIHTGYGANPAYKEWVSRAIFARVKLLGLEADYSSPSSAEVKNTWSYTSTLPYVLMGWCSIKHRKHLHGVVLS